MSPWTALLESLHSSLIDELNERFPNAKPELSIPVRTKAWSPPPGIARILVTPISFDSEKPGLALLATDSGDPKELWASLLKRAGSEFMRRQIKPRVETSISLSPQDPLPPQLGMPERVIWVPFRIEGLPIFLGVAV